MQFPKLDSKWLMFSSMGLELGLSVVVGCLMGSYLDKVFGTDPWLLLLFVLFGCAAGYRSVFRLLKRLNKLNKEAENLPPSLGGDKP